MATPIGVKPIHPAHLCPEGRATCSPVMATAAALLSFDRAAMFSWQKTNLGRYINSWNVASLTVNGVNYTNTYAFTSNLPPKIDGFWYVSYTDNFLWSHFEAR